MCDLLARLFGPRLRDVVPDGVRTVVELAWTEPSEEGQPSEADITRLVEALEARGWRDVQVFAQGYAVELTARRDDTRLELAVGYNGEGPWVAYVDLWAPEVPPDAAAWIADLHDMLVGLGATGLRWYDRAAHDRGDGSDPWPHPIAGRTS